jgi:hypothetical protein
MRKGSLLAVALVISIMTPFYAQEVKPQAAEASSSPSQQAQPPTGQPSVLPASPVPAASTQTQPDTSVQPQENQPPAQPNAEQKTASPTNVEPSSTAQTPTEAPPGEKSAVVGNGAAEPPAHFRGRLFFVNFPSERVFYIEDGAYKTDSLPHLPISSRGEGGAFAAGFSFGILGAAALPAIYKGRQNSLYPDEAVSGLAFFPDGKSVLFTYPKGGDKSRRVGLDGTKMDKFKFGGADPDISRDGKRVLLSSGEIKKGKGRIVQYDLSTDKQTNLAIPGNEPQFCPKLSPDEKQIVYLEGPHGDANLVLCTLQGYAKTVLVGKQAKPVHAAWSPDGKAVYYSSASDSQIHRFTIETREDTTVTSGPGAKLFPVPTPDGKALIYSNAESSGKEGAYGGQFHLKWLDLATGTVSAIELKEPPNYFSATSPAFWQP